MILAVAFLFSSDGNAKWGSKHLKDFELGQKIFLDFKSPGILRSDITDTNEWGIRYINSLTLSSIIVFGVLTIHEWGMEFSVFFAKNKKQKSKTN